MNELLKNGYLIIPNTLNKYNFDLCYNAIQNNTVNYTVVKSIIDNNIINKLEVKLNWDKPVYIKYRVSNNNNSIDASLFHRDIIPLNHYDTNDMIFTCLLYLDEGYMELIPNSHKNNRNQNLNAKKILKLNKNDILIFYSSTIHRGIFYNTSTNRKLIQIFELFPNKETYHKLNNKIYHIINYKEKSNKVIQSFVINLSKIKVI